LKIAYLMNSYPMTSTTFIRREIESLESLGVEVSRFAVRHWGETLVDPLDVAEQRRTHYLLTGNKLELFSSFFSTLIVNPFGLLRATRLWLLLCKNACSFSARQFAYLLQATALFQLCKDRRLHHVHVHFSTNATTVALLARKMGGASYSFTAHGPDEFDNPTSASLGLKIENAAFVVAISNFCKVQLVRFSSYRQWNKIVIAHCGLHLHEFLPNFHFEPENQTFVCIGRLCPQKAQLLIPPALSSLKNEFPNLKVHFIGDGDLRDDLEAAVKEHDVGNMVVLHGWTTNDQAKEMLLESRALLLPSFAEGLPVVIMEALAMGRPVISTYIAGIPELVDEKCGWLVSAGSIEQIQDAIRQALLTSPDKLSAMGREGRSRIEFGHDLKQIAQTLNGEFLKYADQ
jgi:colanic acid/amylovoran biosynthesis glycosyltransferase